MSTRRTVVPEALRAKFARWVESQGPDWKTADERARELLNCSASMVRSVRAGRRKPGLDLALAIERATRGRIKVAEWASAKAAA